MIFGIETTRRFLQVNIELTAALTPLQIDEFLGA